MVTGAQTDQCVRCTIRGGFTRGYDVTLVSDAHTAEDLSQWGAPPPALPATSSGSRCLPH